jgi:hypothetical protein
MKILMITSCACALALIIQEGRASQVTPASPDQDIAVDCVAQCNAHYYRTKSVTTFDKTMFPTFSMAISAANDKAGKCTNLINALTAVEAKNKSYVAGGAKGCITYFTKTLCGITIQSLESCHDQCKSILNDACATHLQ